MDCLLGLFRGEVPKKTKALQSPCYDHQGDGRSRLRNKGCSRESRRHLSCVVHRPGLCRKAKAFPLPVEFPLKNQAYLGLNDLFYWKPYNFLGKKLMNKCSVCMYHVCCFTPWNSMAMPQRALMRLLTPMLRSSLSKLNSRSVNSSTAFKSINLSSDQVDGFLHDAMVIDPQTPAEKNGKLNPPSATNSPKSSRNSPNPQPFPSVPFPAAQAHQQGRGSRDAHHGRHDLKDHHPVDAEERGPVGVRHLQVPVESAKSAL